MKFLRLLGALLLVPIAFILMGILVYLLFSGAWLALGLVWFFGVALLEALSPKEHH